MNDLQIVELYWERSERAITETSVRYEAFCHTIAYNILFSKEDSDECVNDTWLKAWFSMPPHRPEKLSTYLGRITRNLSLNRLKTKFSLKRGGSEATLALDELSECTASHDNVEEDAELQELTAVLNRFLAGLDLETRKILVRRYWYLSSVKEIADAFMISEDKVYKVLQRTRARLREFLSEEGLL